jgi:hypothetical protein
MVVLAAGVVVQVQPVLLVQVILEVQAVMVRHHQ